MANQCITLNLSSGWKARMGRQAVAYVPNPGELPVVKTGIPGGLFMSMEGSNYEPTIHGETADKFLRKTIVLAYGGGNLRDPMTVALSPGQYPVLNTGSVPLSMNDRFSVEFPAAEDATAQTDCLLRNRTKQSCGGFFDAAKPLFGGFMATKKIERNILEELYTRMTRNVRDPAVYNLLTSVANLNHQLTVELAGSVGTMHEIRAFAMGVPAAVMPNNAALAPLINSRAVKEIIQSCSTILSSVSFGTTGIYLGSTFSNPSQKTPWDVVSNNLDGCSETGMMFNAYVTHFQGF